MRARLPFLALLLLALVGLGAVPAARAADGEPARTWSYAVTVDAALARIGVRVCFDGYAPRRMVLDASEACAALRWKDVPDAARRPAWVEDLGAWSVDGVGDGDCLEYEVDVEALLRASKGLGARRYGSALVLPAGAFLAHPALVPEGWTGRATFALPRGARVSTPWPEVPGPAGASPTFVPDATTFVTPCHVVLGAFDAYPIEVAGATLDVAALPGDLASTRDGRRAWLAAAAEAVAALYGRFPRGRLPVVVRPGGASEEPVPFGMAFQGGGPALHLWLASDAKDAALRGEWVAVHEMIHLGQPMLAKDDAWFVEGFTTYYQEVLRARAGMETPEAAWATMEEGFAAGRRTTDERTLAEASRTMDATHAYRRVYWAGAAVALRADVLLRRAGAAPFRSLDDVMRWILETYGASRAVHTAEEILAAADARLGAPTLLPVARAVLATPAFPATDDLRAWLGVEPKAGGAYALRDDAPGAATRRAILDGGRAGSAPAAAPRTSFPPGR